MRSRFVEPAPVRLELAEGDWLLVKRRLNQGEQREYVRSYTTWTEDGKRRIDPLDVGRATVVAYLLDWSLTDEAGKPVVIRNLAPADLGRVLDNLDPDEFTEVRAAIDAHDLRQQEARDAEKKRRTGASGADPTSPSPSAVDGILTGSAV